MSLSTDINSNQWSQSRAITRNLNNQRSLLPPKTLQPKENSKRLMDTGTGGQKNWSRAELVSADWLTLSGINR